jgi:hypothetical protein
MKTLFVKEDRALDKAPIVIMDTAFQTHFEIPIFEPTATI